MLPFLHSLLLSFSFASHDPIALDVELLLIYLPSLVRSMIGLMARMTPVLYTHPDGFAMVLCWKRTNTEG